MTQYLIQRTLWAIAILVVVVALVFAIVFVVPGAAGNSGESKYPPVAVRIASKLPTPATTEAIIDRGD